jgi:Radical SAM proteins, N-terminal
MKKIVESYKQRLAAEDGWVLKRGAQLRIALCYPNTYAIGMANLGFQAMYEIFNGIPEVSCERVFLPDSVRSPTVREGSSGRRALPNGQAHPSRNGSGYDVRPNGRTADVLDELREYERTRTPLLSLESQTPVRDFDVIAFSISFETDYVNMARMLQMSGVPVWAKDRTARDPLIVMGGASSFLNPEPIADFTDVIGVGEGEILGPKIVDAILENETKDETLLALARQGRGFYVPSLYEVSYHDDGLVAAYVPLAEGVPARVGRAISAENPKEGSLRRAIRRGESDIAEQLRRDEVFAPSTTIFAPQA